MASPVIITSALPLINISNSLHNRWRWFASDKSTEIIMDSTGCLCIAA